MMQRRSRSIALRSVEQALWSASTFLGTSIGAALLTVSQFGQVTVTVSLILIFQALVRSCFGEVVPIVRVMGRDPMSYYTWGFGRLASSYLLALLALSLVLALVSEPAVTAYLICSIAAAMVLTLVDFGRTTLLNSNRGLQSTLVIATGVTGQISVLVLSTIESSATPTSVMLSWVVGLTIMLLCQAAILLRRRNRESWRSVQFSNARYFAAEALITVGASQGSIVLLGATSGNEYAAGIRGAFLVMFPVSMALQALNQTLVADVNRVASAPNARRHLQFLALALATGVVIYTLLTGLLNTPLAILLGDSVTVSLQALPGVAAFLAGQAFFLIPWAAARSLSRPAMGLAARTVIAPITLLLPLTLALFSGGVGVVIAYAVVGVSYIAAGVSVFALLFRRNDDESKG